MSACRTGNDYDRSFFKFIQCIRFIILLFNFDNSTYVKCYMIHLRRFEDKLTILSSHTLEFYLEDCEKWQENVISIHVHTGMS